MELIILSIFLILFIIIAIFIAAYTVSSIVLFQRNDKKQTNYFENINDHQEFKSFGNKQTFGILSPRGYKLSCILLKQDEQLKKDSKVVILSPSLYNNPDCGLKNYDPDFINIFFQKGFDVLIYNTENDSAVSEIPCNSMGYYEKDDLKAVTNWVYDYYDSYAEVGTFGSGTGAAAVVMHASEEKRIRFIIVDSLFTNLKSYLKNKLKYDYRVSSFPILNLSEIIITKRGGFSVKDVSPLQIFKNDEVTAPILFIYGENDIYTPPKMLVDLYNNKAAGYKKYYFAKNTGHCESFIKNPEEYKEKINEFLKETGII